jgi:hypothetical protein
VPQPRRVVMAVPLDDWVRPGFSFTLHAVRVKA